MRLKELKYIEPGFSIDGLYLNYVGLIVGRNAVGKSRVLAVIKKFYELITQRYTLKETDFFEYDVVFADGEIDLRYRFVCQAGEVFLEFMDDSYSHYLDRQEGTTYLYGENINPPKNKLVVNVRRDVEKYPEIEKIVCWAESLFLLQSGHTDVYGSESEQSIVNMFERLDEERRLNVMMQMCHIGYQIENLRLGEVCQSYKILLVSEKDVLRVLRFDELSQAMQKSLYMCVLLNYLVSEGKDSRTIVIDDLCDGMDRDKATEMGKCMYEFCIKNDIQLIATTNDIFLMNVVNLNYWNMLCREGGRVMAFNMHNAEEAFVKFKAKNLQNYEFIYYW